MDKYKVVVDRYWHSTESFEVMAESPEEARLRGFEQPAMDFIMDDEPIVLTILGQANAFKVEG